MKSVTKNRLENDEIKNIINIHFPEEIISDIKEFEDGMFNAVYFVLGNDKLRHGAVLKLGPLFGTKLLTYEKELIKTEVEVYKVLADTKVPTPKILAEDFSKSVLPCDYFIMEYMEGETWKNTQKSIVKQNRNNLLRELGRYNAEINSLDGKWFGYIKEDKDFHFDNWYDAFYSMIDNILKDGEKDNLKLPYDKILQTIERHKVCLDEVDESKLVCFDIWAGNVFLKQIDNAVKISGFIDVERCFYGDPVADFACSKLSWMYDIEKEPEFLNGYNEVATKKINLGKSEKIRMNLYCLYLSLIMYVETYRYNKIVAFGTKVYTKFLIKKYLKLLK